MEDRNCRRLVDLRAAVTLGRVLGFAFAVGVAGFAVMSACIAWAWQGGLTVTFESRESKTLEGGPVFNRVKLVQSQGRDLWLMHQSHLGPGALEQSPDRLVIEVQARGDRTVARFSQLRPGSLTEGAPSDEREYAVACGLCHANGPRALRPRWDSTAMPVGVRDRFVVWAWNLRIKTLGVVESESAPTVGEPPHARRVSFAPTALYWQEVLPVASCKACHGGSGLLISRSPLKRMHFLAARFLLSEGEMPPPLHSLSAEDAKVTRMFFGMTD